MSSQYKYWKPYIGPFDPCPPIKIKVYATPRNYIWAFNHLDYLNSQPLKKYFELELYGLNCLVPTHHQKEG